MNIVGFPIKKLAPEILADILPAAEATRYVELMHNHRAFATIIGTVTEKKEKSVVVKKYSKLSETAYCKIAYRELLENRINSNCN